MLRPIDTWRELREALEARGQAVYICEECGHLWITSSTEPSVRCPRCRVWANGHRRVKPGRPYNICPKCEATDPQQQLRSV